jgi:hypothetical protein
MILINFMLLNKGLKYFFILNLEITLFVVIISKGIKTNAIIVAVQNFYTDLK